jgi:hypothetical protein
VHVAKRCRIAERSRQIRRCEISNTLPRCTLSRDFVTAISCMRLHGTVEGIDLPAIAAALSRAHACFRNRTTQQNLTTAARWSSPWLPNSYGQDIWQVLNFDGAGGDDSAGG